MPPQRPRPLPPHAEHPLPQHRGFIPINVYKNIRYHFSSVKRKTLLCPYRHQYKEVNCPFTPVDPNFNQGCVFAHREEDLVSSCGKRKEEFNLQDWITKKNLY